MNADGPKTVRAGVAAGPVFRETSSVQASASKRLAQVLDALASLAPWAAVALAVARLIAGGAR